MVLNTNNKYRYMMIFNLTYSNYLLSIIGTIYTKKIFKNDKILKY